MLFDRLRSIAAERAVAAPVNGLSRRIFLKTGIAAGGGLMLGFSLPAFLDDAVAAESSSFAPNAFIRIGSDGSVTLTMPYVGMGQGTYTSIPMLIAEELELDVSQVRSEHAPPNEKLYGNPLLAGIQATGNSNAIRAAWEPLQQAAATARVMLIAAAAQHWKVDPSSCHAKRGEVVHPASARKIEGGAPVVRDHLDALVTSDIKAEDLRRQIENHLGPSGFALFMTVEPDVIMSRLGRTYRSVQYAIANPLIAKDVSDAAAKVCFYTPLRLAVFEDNEEGSTHIIFGLRSGTIRHPRLPSWTRNRIGKIQRIRRKPRVVTRVLRQYMHSTMEKLSGKRTYR